MKKTKYALLHSVLALLLCVSMLVGTTFAWFTDSVSSAKNQIIAGNLDIELAYSKDMANWSSVAGKSDIVDPNALWEPGHTEVVYLKISNEGTLGLKYSFNINFEDTVVGKSVLGNDIYLSQYLKYAVVDVNSAYADRDAARKAVASVAKPLAGYSVTGTMAKGAAEKIVALVIYMPETVGNEANYRGDAIPRIDMGITLIATQMEGELDSFGSDYDSNAAADFFPGFQGGAGQIPLSLDEQGYTTEEVTFDFGDITVVIPVGVKVAKGHSSVYASAETKDTSKTSVKLSDTEKMRPSDVHIEGVAEDNTKAMFVILKHYLPTGLNSGALTLYHVENDVDVPMTHAVNPVNHNEFYYDPLTGDVTLALASFSEIAVIADTNNPWDGKTEIAYSGSGTEADPYLIANADQLAYFRTQVDNGNSFEGKFVKLDNNIYLSGKLFEPIGWGYVNTKWNRGGVDGKVFQGTFDGNGKTIFDLYQSGWDLINEGTGEAYTYTNCGFGLFAAASGATFKNLTISGAYVRVECVEAGILVGLSQNNCTYQNIKILNSKVANYQRPAGGLIGEVSGTGTTTITNVTIGSDVVVGSLWGDFDAPCGGVIGARWDDVGANPQIVMSNVEVGARMDVYNDITSAYQWHAYRRAGMLIGNTELSDPNNAHKAYAPFLTCTNVKVYYGDWVNYTYCSFSNHNARYPWVRTQAGENCTAFSNPRWGVPNDANGQLVTDMNHVHAEGDECNVLRQFSQLYGGGQGVYGQDKHDGVEVVDQYYSITYVNDGKTLDIVYVTDNTKAFTVGSDQAQKLVLEWAEDNIQGGTIAFGGWMNAASIKLTEIPKDNTKNVVLYPYFNSPYTASFVDQQGNILAWCLFNDADVSRLSAAFKTATSNLPALEKDYELINWKIRGTDTNGNLVNAELVVDNTNWEDFKGYKDVTITPHYRYKGVDLIEVYDELTGDIDHYQVAGYSGGVGSTLVEIPAYVNGKPVIKVNDGAFKSYDDLYAAVIPGTITHIGSNAFTEISGSKRDQVTLYYEGKPEDWKRAMDDLYVNKAYSYYTDYNTAGTYTEAAYLTLDSSWDSGAGDGSRVFFLDENGKVDLSKGYWELYKTTNVVSKEWYGNKYGTVYIWIYHDHPYDDTLNEYKNCPNEDTHYGSFTDYDAADRPDKAYWEGVTAN